MGTLMTHGEFPDIVCRAFEKREYAEEFLNGKIRFGRIYYYKHIEDETRRDRTEGESHIRYAGEDKHAMFASNVIYILCCHQTVKAARYNGQNKHIVLIRNPRRLADDITTTIRGLPGKYFGGVEGCAVSYTKGHESQHDPSAQELAQLAYCQKPDRFQTDEEFRFVVIRKDSVGEFLTVPLNAPLDYLEYIRG